MIHAWLRTEEHADSAERLGEVLMKVGPSILLTSLTNSLAFAVGISAPSPVIRMFCTMAAIAMATDFLYELTFFAGALARWGPSVDRKVSMDKQTPEAICTALESSCGGEPANGLHMNTSI